MITPEFWEYELNVLQAQQDLQESILRDVTRRMLKTDLTVTDTAAWQAEKLQGAGMIYDDLVKEVAKATQATEQEIRKVFADAETEIFNYDDNLIVEAGYNPVELKNLSPAMARVWDATLKKTCTEAENLTKTTAVTSQSLYIQACDLAHLQVSSGAFSYQDAIRSGIQFAARQGVTVVYDSGWVSGLDVAIRRSVLTGVNQTAGQLQMMRAEELGTDIMELTAHMGARIEHAFWQGKLVSLSGKPGYLSLLDIGYGDVRGFMGANCRHNWHMFWPGISSPAYTPEQLKEFQNATVTYNGQQMPVADAIAKQRGYERTIRQTKRELVMFDETIKNGQDMNREFSKSAVKLKNQEARLKDFCEQTGLKRDRFREQMFAQKTENSIRGFGKSTAQKAVWADRKEYIKFAKSVSPNMEGLPASIDKYREIKYNNKSEYARMRKYFHVVEKGEVSPLLGYKKYKDVALEVENHVIGMSTKDNITINDYSAHFVGRVIGESGLSSKFNRNGVSIADIKDTLKNGDIGKTIVNPKNEKSKVYIGAKCKVAINPDDGKLIQVNPLEWR